MLRASARAWTMVTCESVWVGGAWKGDICTANAAHIDPAPYGPGATPQILIWRKKQRKERRNSSDKVYRQVD